MIINNAQNCNSISVRAVIRHRSLILVEWFTPKSICFLPGGRIEPNDDSMSALKRELHEEIEGARFEIGKYLGSVAHFWSTAQGKDSCLNLFYEAQTIMTETISAREKGRELRWIDRSETGNLKPSILKSLLFEIVQPEPWSFVERE